MRSTALPNVCAACLGALHAQMVGACPRPGMVYERFALRLCLCSGDMRVIINACVACPGAMHVQAGKLMGLSAFSRWTWEAGLFC
jgi:hypothetical protein